MPFREMTSGLSACWIGCAALFHRRRTSSTLVGFPVHCLVQINFETIVGHVALMCCRVGEPVWLRYLGRERFPTALIFAIADCSGVYLRLDACVSHLLFVGHVQLATYYNGNQKKREHVLAIHNPS
jgi:hypothetical protein